MKKGIDQLNQHVFVPVILFLASISLVLALYFCSEWITASRQLATDQIYTYHGAVEPQKYGNEAFKCLLVFLGTTLICTWAMAAKNRLLSISAITVTFLGLMYLIF